MPDMSIDSFKSELTNPARTYLWEVLFPNPIGGSTQTLLLRARSSAIPGVSVGSIHIPYKQTAGVKFPGKKTFSHTWSCTFIENEDRVTWDIFYAWAQAAVGAETGIGILGLKRDAYLNLLNTDGSIAKSIKMVGLFVESQDDVGLSHDSEEVVTISITFSYDYWVEK